MKKALLIYIPMISILLGCGVRGDPIPPGAPAELGYGSPRYKDPRNRMIPPKVPTPEALKKADEEEQKELKEKSKDKKN